MTTAADLTRREAGAGAGFDVERAARAIARATEAREPSWALERREAAAGIARRLSLPSREDEL